MNQPNLLCKVALGERHSGTGFTRHTRNGKPLPPPTELRIVQYPGDPGYYLFSLRRVGRGVDRHLPRHTRSGVRAEPRRVRRRAVRMAVNRTLVGAVRRSDPFPLQRHCHLDVMLLLVHPQHLPRVNVQLSISARLGKRLGQLTAGRPTLSRYPRLLVATPSQCVGAHRSARQLCSSDSALRNGMPARTAIAKARRVSQLMPPTKRSAGNPG